MNHTSVDENFIHFEASGTISCELQWGSNSDVRRADGALLSDSFPFECYLISSVEDPTSIEAKDDALRVDASSWYENYYDEKP